MRIIVQWPESQTFPLQPAGQCYDDKSLNIAAWLLATVSHAQEVEREPFVRVYFAVSMGIGIPGQTSVISGGPLMGQMTIPLRFRHNWFIIPEAYGMAFRSPKFPEKRGLIFESYPRHLHQMYGLRFGRSFAPPDNGFSILPSVGIDYFQVDEPYLVKTGGLIFPTKLEYKTYALYAIPIQIDLRFQKKRESFAAFAIGVRYNKNDRRPFGSISAGMELDLNE